MNALPPLPGQLEIHGGLHTRRCVRHEVREAAARCPDCRRDFCRECVVDHAGRLLCATCVGKLATSSRIERESRWPRIRRGLAVGAALIAVWGAFFIVGRVLLAIPVAVHEGTIWKNQSEAGR